MKKMFMMLAATFICGASVFTSCSKDDKNDEPAPAVNNNVYEVNLTAIVHDCSAPYLMINLEYTGADGVKHTETVKGSEATDNILPEALAYYNDETNMFRQLSEKAEQLYSHFKVKNFKMTVPAGKSFSFKGTIAAVPNSTAPTEEFNLIRPLVLVTAKRVSGNSEDVSILVKNSSAPVKHYFKIDPAGYDEAIAVNVGNKCGEGSFTF